MINIAICDDNKKDIDLLISLLEKFNKKRENIEININSYTDTSYLMNDIEKGNMYDIYFLDIIMPGKSDIELCKYLRSIESEAIVIFTTISKEYALEAYLLEASQYILKPVQENILFKVLNKEIDSMNIRNSKIININSKEGTRKIPYHKIVFVDTKNHIAFFHLSTGEIVETKTLRESFNDFTKILTNDERFLRPHYSFLINIDYVEKMTSKEFEMRGGKNVPISKSKLSIAKERYMSYH